MNKEKDQICRVFWCLWRITEEKDHELHGRQDVITLARAIMTLVSDSELANWYDQRETATNSMPPGSFLPTVTQWLLDFKDKMKPKEFKVKTYTINDEIGKAVYPIRGRDITIGVFPEHYECVHLDESEFGDEDIPDDNEERPICLDVDGGDTFWLNLAEAKDVRDALTRALEMAVE